jgi:two-component system CheB/CheR fusion protein
MLKEIANVNEINFHNEIDENEIVFADQKMLLSILQNLISNALRHTRPGGKINVTAKANEDKLIIKVKDNGVGIRKNNKKPFTAQMALFLKQELKIRELESDYY